MFSKILYLLSSILFVSKTYSSTPCYTKTDVSNSKTLFTYDGNVYDITGYKHPAGKSTLLKAVGGPLEDWLDMPKYDFHYSKKSFKNDMEEMLVGPLNESCSQDTTITEKPTCSLKNCDTTTKLPDKPTTTNAITTNAITTNAITTNAITTNAITTNTITTENPILNSSFRNNIGIIHIIAALSCFF